MPPTTLTSGQKTIRSLGLTVLLVSLLYVLVLAFTVSANTEGGQWKRLGLMVAMLSAAVALGAMLVDAFDFWVRGRRFTPFSLKMLHSLVFVCMLAAFALTLFVPGAALMLTITPALLIYLFGVVRKPGPVRRPAGSGRQRRGRPAEPGRQRRGGRKRK